MYTNHNFSFFSGKTNQFKVLEIENKIKYLDAKHFLGMKKNFLNLYDILTFRILAPFL